MNTSQELQLEWRDYCRIIVRRRWVLIGALFAAGLAGTIAAALWPVLYRSEALILVERQGVPADYVKPNVVANSQQQLQSITELVLSRSRLDRLVAKYDLYPDVRHRQDVDELVDRIRKDIQVVPIETSSQGELTAFRIYFTNASPTLAREVNSDLTSEFINRGLESQTQQSVATTNFFEAQLDAATKQLSQQEQRLRIYEARYLGELPAQQQSNLGILNSYEAQLYDEGNALNQAEQEQIYLESLASAYRQQSESGGTGQGLTPLEVIDKTITNLQSQLSNLEAKYTSSYPDVVHVKGELALWRQRREKALAAGKTARKEPGNSSNNALAADAPEAINAQSRLKANQAVIAYHQRQIKTLKADIAQMQSRLRLAPLREEQLAEVTRNAQNARAQYQELLQKKLQSQLATNLVEGEQGEQFRLIDPPSLPQRPILPNRLEIVLGGWSLGLAVGIGFVALQESTDESLRNAADAGRTVPFPILSRVPILRSAEQERLALRMKCLEIGAVILMVVISAGFGAYICHIG